MGTKNGIVQEKVGKIQEKVAKLPGKPCVSLFTLPLAEADQWFVVIWVNSVALVIRIQTVSCPGARNRLSISESDFMFDRVKGRQLVLANMLEKMPLKS